MTDTIKSLQQLKLGQILLLMILFVVELMFKCQVQTMNKNWTLKCKPDSYKIIVCLMLVLGTIESIFYSYIFGHKLKVIQAFLQSTSENRMFRFQTEPESKHRLVWDSRVQISDVRTFGFRTAIYKKSGTKRSNDHVQLSDTNLCLKSERFVRISDVRTKLVPNRQPLSEI